MMNSTLQCEQCPLRDASLLCDVAQEFRLGLNQTKKILRLNSGQTLCYEGHPSAGLYVILKGYFSVYRHDEQGKRQIFRLLGPGSLIGRSTLFGKTNHNHGADALSASLVCLIDGRLAKEVIMRSPKLAFRLFTYLANDLESAEKRMQSLANESIPKRLAGLLCQLQDAAYAGPSFLARLSRSDMASYIASTPESVSRAFQLLKKIGIIDYRGKKITILDRSKIQALN